MASKLTGGALDMIGKTPLVRLPSFEVPGGAQIWAKAEQRNPGGSVKDRPALQMVLAAEGRGELLPGSTIVEATSGNTGISLAMIASARGYRCILVMPEDMSVTRRLVMKSFGAEIELTPAAMGMLGAVRKAEAILKRLDLGYCPKQFENPANVEAHQLSTGPEILEQSPIFPTAFVTGVGSGGTITGVAKVLKERAVNPEQLKIVAVEPLGSAVLSGGKPGMHALQGLGAGFVPPILDRALLDEIITVSDVQAERTMRALANQEGLLVGPSSGANVFAAANVAARGEGLIVTVLCDTGERYLA